MQFEWRGNRNEGNDVSHRTSGSSESPRNPRGGRGGRGKNHGRKSGHSRKINKGMGGPL